MIDKNYPFRKLNTPIEHWNCRIREMFSAESMHAHFFPDTGFYAFAFHIDDRLKTVEKPKNWEIA